MDGAATTTAVSSTKLLIAGASLVLIITGILASALILAIEFFVSAPVSSSSGAKEPTAA
jgi:hypothetical protein